MTAGDSTVWPEDVTAAVARWRLQDLAAPVAIARAPGRLDVLGGIADYSGSVVLQRPIAEAVVAVAHHRENELLRIRTDVATDGRHVVELPMSLFQPGGDACTVEGAHRCLGVDSLPAWTPYIAGVLALLVQEEGFDPTHGLAIDLSSEVPDGKGVSSSAAVEVATAGALVRLAGLSVPPARIAMLCQRVENRVVGAPCGLMDQMTSVFGRHDALFALHCVPDRVLPPVPIAPGYAFWGMDSGVRHAVTGADYGSVRVAAFMAYRLLLEAAGIASAAIAAEDVVDTRWQGYLANVNLDEIDDDFAGTLPERLSGCDFLARFDAITDDVTRVEVDRHYPVRAATRHPVLEHRRVLDFAASMSALKTCEDPRQQQALAHAMGQELYRSHSGYSDCGLGSHATDALVAAVREAGAKRGLYGARISGGGSGGTVAVFGRAVAEPLVPRDRSPAPATDRGRG